MGNGFCVEVVAVLGVPGSSMYASELIPEASGGVRPMKAIACFISLSVLLLLSGCGEKTSTTSATTPKPAPGAPTAKPKKITIGLVAKANANQVFQVAKTAAEATAKDRGAKEGIEIVVDWRTPEVENAIEQARNIEALANTCDGISVSCSDGDKLAGPITAAVDKGVPVMTFDSDSPNSKRFCYFGTDDAALGKRLVQELVSVMGDKGVVGILAGNQNAPNLKKRVDACREELKKHPNIKLAGPTNGAFYHDETGQAAAAAWASAQNANPEITGWVLVGGWPLFTQGATKALGEPGKVKVVSCDALPAMLAYLRDGSVQVLVAQDLWGWGAQSVNILTDKIVHNKTPEKFVYGELTRVSKDNVEEYAKKWEQWAPTK